MRSTGSYAISTALGEPVRGIWSDAFGRLVTLQGAVVGALFSRAAMARNAATASSLCAPST